MVTLNTFEEKIRDMAQRKLLLDHLVVGNRVDGKGGNNVPEDGSIPDSLTMSELQELLGFGVDKMGMGSSKNGSASEGYVEPFKGQHTQYRTSQYAPYRRIPSAPFTLSCSLSSHPLHVLTRLINPLHVGM